MNLFPLRFLRVVSRCGPAVFLVFVFAVAGLRPARAEAMLELFQMSWSQVSQKMPEIAEAGYDSLWLPNPAKGNSGAYSIGYDQFDPFDLGSTNQQGTVATRYGTQDELIRMVQTAHRFGIRVYFDNIMNHRSSTVPGYPGSGTPTNYYPGLVPQDFHLQTVSGGFANWPSIGDPYWCTTSVVQNQPLLGLCDLAQEPGTVNWNFGNSLGNTATKPVFVRFPNRPDLYMDTNGPVLGTGWGGPGWRPFNGHGQPVAEDVSVYLCRAVAWTLYMTKCDGFRLDAVKHVPSNFFGNNTGQTDDPSFAGYTGAIQAMYDYVHGYGNNVTGNGYVETDGNRNSLFNTEAPRNDAMIFGEHISPAPTFAEYLGSGMRLCNQPLYNQMNNALNGYASLAGMDGRDYAPAGVNCDGTGNYSAAQGVNFPQTQDGSSCCPVNQGLEDAYLFLREGLPMVYADGFNHNTGGGTPIASYANYLGEFGDNSMPDVMYLHHQLARGGTWARWGDQNIVAFERYDYREGSLAQNQGVVLFVMNDKTTFPGDITFDDGVSQATNNDYYGSISVSNSKGQGLVVGFPPGSVLVQLASSSPTGGRAYPKLLVHAATTSQAAAQADSSRTNSDPAQRLIFVGSQTLASGGGAIELNVPSGAWVMYGYQWPEASRANVSTNAIVLRQGGGEVPHIQVNRTDGPNGDPGYNPVYPFKMGGRVDPYGNVIGGVHVASLTYAIDVPVVTNANFDILVRSDASSANTLVKLDGGVDLNSQMNLGPTNGGVGPAGYDLRDNKPGYATDVFLGYEQTAFQFRNGPEKFAAKNTLSNNIVSLGAETYYYTVGGTNLIVPGAGYGQNIYNATASFVYHDPAATNTAVLPNNSATQRMPLNPANNQPADIYIKSGYQFQANTCFLYYTTDGSNPEGAFGTGKGTTKVIQAGWLAADSAVGTIDWWKVTIPAQPDGTPVRYKVGLFSGGSVYAGQSIPPVSDAETSGAKLYGLTQAAITNFNPATAVVWLHNDLNTNSTVTGLQSGFHIVRARSFLPRTNQSSVYNTYLQTFYYAGALPTGTIVFPANSSTINSSNYTVVVRADSTVTGVDFNIQDGSPGNDDILTGQNNGNGNGTNGAPAYAAAAAVTPNAAVSAAYPNYPQEFRFVYARVPASGTATISVRLKDFAAGIYTNRITVLAATVNTLAPAQVVQIYSPATDSAVLTYSTNMIYLVQACFTSSLSSQKTNFNVLINGVLQPQSAYIINASGSCAGMKSLYYYWNNPPLGTNVIQVIYTNAVPPVSDTRLVTLAPPLKISGLANNNQLVVWDSAPGINYQVLATTNLTQPFEPVSGVIPGSGTSTYFYDPNPAGIKFYRIEMLP